MWNSHSRICGLFAGLCLVVAFSGGVAHALTFDEVMAPIAALGAKCHAIEQMAAYSPQAETLYRDDQVAKMLEFKPDAQQFRSFACGRDPVTVFLYQFPSVLEAQKQLRTAQGLVWGGSSPSYHHPERIFSLDNLVVVVSGAKPKLVANTVFDGTPSAEKKK